MSHKPDPNKNVNLTINGVPVTVPEGTRILEAAKKVNIHIPTLCEHPELCKRALCRICVVEADGRGKLIAACANDVWEGVNIVTNNLRLLNVRKTILELILANHPQDCLFCVRNKTCELQSLAAEFGVYDVPFVRIIDSDDAARHLPSTEGETLKRDMDKCVKCGRCVEACQEVQKIGAINTAGRSKNFNVTVPYKQVLEDGPCVFCGKCASVCPVGAIFENDQSTQVWDALNNKEKSVIAYVSSQVSSGKIIAALKMLGFDKVYDVNILYNASNAEINNELEKRIKSGGKLPIISGYSKGVSRFVKRFYPDLTEHLVTTNLQKKSDITTVLFTPDIALKYGLEKNNFALTANELDRMLKLAGIAIETLPEESFDTIDLPKLANQIYKPDIVCGFAQVREILDSIRNGASSGVKWIEITG